MCYLICYLTISKIILVKIILVKIILVKIILVKIILVKIILGKIILVKVILVKNDFSQNFCYLICYLTRDSKKFAISFGISLYPKLF